MTDAALDIRIEPLTADEVLGPRLEEVIEVWTWADDERVQDTLPRHAGREGFRFLAATAGDRLVGFVYGYLGAPGQWWHDIVAGAMDAGTRRRWLAPGHFELVELHVHPDVRRRGLGGRLHDAVLEGLGGRTAVLSTQTDNEPALRLYLGRGWQIVVGSLRFSPAGQEFAILGRDL